MLTSLRLCSCTGNFGNLYIANVNASWLIKKKKDEVKRLQYVLESLSPRLKEEKD